MENLSNNEVGSKNNHKKSLIVAILIIIVLGIIALLLWLKYGDRPGSEVIDNPFYSNNERVTLTPEEAEAKAKILENWENENERVTLTPEEVAAKEERLKALEN